MKSISLRTALLVIAVLAAWSGAIRSYVSVARPFRATSLVKVGNVPLNQVVARVGDRAEIARAMADPAIARLPGLQGRPDLAAEVADRLTVRIRPDAALVEVDLDWASGVEAAAIVNAVVDRSLATTPPGELRRINLATANQPFRRFRPLPAIPITVAAATALLLLLFGPGLLRRAWTCPACGRWGFFRATPAA